MPMRRRQTGMRVTSAAPMRTSPSSGMTKPAMMRSSVVLPDPEGPSRLVKRPASKPALTRSSTFSAPNVLVSPLTSTPPTHPSELGEEGKSEHQDHGDAEKQGGDGVDLR